MLYAKPLCLGLSFTVVLGSISVSLAAGGHGIMWPFLLMGWLFLPALWPLVFWLVWNRTRLSSLFLALVQATLIFVAGAEILGDPEVPFRFGLLSKVSLLSGAFGVLWLFAQIFLWWKLTSDSGTRSGMRQVS